MNSQITSVVVPSNAEPGDGIILDVYVKNITGVDQDIAVTAVYDSTEIPFQFDYLTVLPGETVMMRGNFVMPDRSITIYMSSWHWSGSQWVIDDSTTRAITVPISDVWSKVGSPIVATVINENPVPDVWSKVGSPIVATVHLGEIPPEFKLVESVVYPDGKTYNGEAQRCTASFTFLPANWPGAKWFIDHMIAKHIADKVREGGGLPLNFKLYENGFNYIMVIESGVASAAPFTQAVAFPVIAWSTVILAALILAAIIVISVVILKTEDFFYKSPAAASIAGLIALGIAGAALVGLAMVKGTSAKEAVTGKQPAKT